MTPVEAVTIIVGGCAVVALAGAAAELRWRRQIIEHRTARARQDAQAAHSQVAHERWQRARLEARVARLENLADGGQPTAVLPRTVLGSTNGRHPS